MEMGIYFNTHLLFGGRMAFTDKVTPSIYQLNKTVTSANIGMLKSSGDGSSVLTDAGTYVFNDEPASLRWFLRMVPPTGYLALYGQTLSRYTYTNLFEALTMSYKITLSNISTKTYFTVSDVSYFAANTPVTLETTVAFPGSTLSNTKLYYVQNLDVANKRFQLSTDLTTTNIINISDALLTSITGIQKCRLYPLSNYGDNSTTFTLLDARGWFLRAKDDTRVLGSKQLDAFQGHWHLNAASVYSLNGSGDVGGIGTLARQILSNTGGTYTVPSSTYGDPRVDSETRGKNIAALLCLKF